MGPKPYDTRIEGNPPQSIASKRCRVTGDLYVVSVPRERALKWMAGELIQVAFPDLNADQREFLISGSTPAEWKEMWE